MARPSALRGRLVGASLALGLALAGCAADPGPAPSSAPPSATTPSSDAPSTSLDPFDVAVGDCVDESTGQGEVTQVPVVPCEDPHQGEAYASLRLEGGAYPGLDAIAESARGCEAPFEDFVGRPLLGSRLRVTYLHPTPQSWSAGDREILCVVSDPDGPSTGSLEGSRR